MRANVNPSTRSTSSVEIQIGERTQSHDHVMTPVSLRTMKQIVSSPTKLIPPEDELEEDIRAG
jgi:hypothetical protein